VRTWRLLSTSIAGSRYRSNEQSRSNEQNTSVPEKTSGQIHGCHLSYIKQTRVCMRTACRRTSALASRSSEERGSDSQDRNTGMG
jgi:hypothetical protein